MSSTDAGAAAVSRSARKRSSGTRLPASIRISGQRWRIKYVKNLGKNFGETHPAQRLILIEKNSHENMVHVLLHEILHACFVSASFHLPPKREEDAVRALSGTLLSVFRDNPKFL